jgi:hypothetical protein
MNNKLILISMCFFIFLGCSQNIDQVSITPRNPAVPTYIFIGDGEYQGGNSQTAVSASAALSSQTAGGNLKRTTSTSASFQMTSGIGVD